MKHDSKFPLPAVVDVAKVRYSKGVKLGIDFSNEIDAWAKMEFKYREQIKKLRDNGTLDGHDVLRDLNTLVYAIREKID